MNISDLSHLRELSEVSSLTGSGLVGLSTGLITAVEENRNNGKRDFR